MTVPEYTLRLLSPMGKPLLLMGPYTQRTAVDMRGDLLNVMTHAATVQLLDPAGTVLEEMSRQDRGICHAW